MNASKANKYGPGGRIGSRQYPAEERGHRHCQCHLRKDYPERGQKRAEAVRIGQVRSHGSSVRVPADPGGDVAKAAVDHHPQWVQHQHGE